MNWPLVILALPVFVNATEVTGTTDVSTANEGRQTIVRAWEESADGSHVQASSEELQRARALFARTLRDPASERLVSAWGELGFDWRTLRIGERSVWLLRERESARRGRGVYLFAAPREESAESVAPVIEAPHRFYDRHTGRLALEWFLAGGFRAGAWNSVHRYRGADDYEPDLAHLESSYLTALHQALGAQPQEMAVYQLHGFAASKREAQPARSADWIISSAREWPGSAATRLADCLARHTETRALLYPLEVSVLGGTTNTTAAALRAAGGGPFVHVEMEAALRQRLREEAALRETVRTCLLQ